MTQVTEPLAEAVAEAARRQEEWDFAGARTLLETAIQQHGDGGLTALTALRMLAEVLRELGDLNGARTIAAPLLATCEQRYGHAHPSTVRTTAVLAMVTHDLGDLVGAEKLYHSVLDANVREDGPAGRAVRLARVNLALLHRDKGNYEIARSMLNAAYVVHRRAYGVEDLDTVRIAAELAALHLADGDVTSARRLMTVAHAGARARLGEQHPFTQAVERDLAEVEPGMPSPPVSVVPATGAVWRADRRRSAPVTAEHPVLVGTLRPGRKVWPWALAVAGSALVVSVAVAAMWLSGPGTGADARPQVTPPPPGPAAVRVDDRGTTLGVRWTNRGDVNAPIVVALARDEQPPSVIATLPAGTSEYVVQGVDPLARYCVVVGLVVTSEPVAPAVSFCTGARSVG